MTSPRKSSPVDEVALVSYDASGEFQYDVAARTRSDIPGGVPYPGVVEEGRSTILVDWNRAITTIPDEGIFIGDASLYSILIAQYPIQSQLSESEKNPKTNKDYYDITMVGDKPVFKSMDGLKNFWSRYLFNQVAADQHAQLQKFAAENLHQNGLPFAAELQFTPDRAVLKDNMSIPNIKIVYTPTETGVSFITTSSHRMSDQAPESPPAIRFKTESAIELGESGSIQPPTGHIRVEIFDDKFKNYALGRGYMGSQLMNYRNNKETYHPNTERKKILDELMERMFTLFMQRKQEELVSLFYIYSALKDWDFSNQHSIDMFEKAVRDYHLNLSSKNQNYVFNIYDKLYKDMGRPLPDDTSPKKSAAEKSWQDVFSALTITVANNKISIFDQPAFIDAIAIYCKEVSFTPENINFLIEIRKMILYPETFDPKKLMELYIRQPSNFQINISSDQRIALEKAFEDDVEYKKTGKGRPISIDDFKLAADEIVRLMNKDVLPRARTDKNIIKLNSSEVDAKLSNALRSVKNIIDVTLIYNEYKKIMSSPEQPQLIEVMNLKKKLMNAIELCPDKNNKEILQRAIGIVDNRWKPDVDYQKIKDKFAGKEFQEWCRLIFEDLDQIYKRVDTNDPKAFLDFQRKSMLAIELMNTIINTSTSKKGIDSNKAGALLSLMANFENELRKDLDDGYRKTHNVTNLCDAMKKHVAQNSKALGAQSRLARFMSRKDPEPLTRLVTLYDGMSKEYMKEYKQEQAMAKKMEPKNDEWLNKELKKRFRDSNFVEGRQMFNELDDAYQRLDNTDPQAKLHFQQKAMLAMKFAAVIDAYALEHGGFSRMDSKKAQALKDMMTDFNASIATDLPSKHVYMQMVKNLNKGIQVLRPEPAPVTNALAGFGRLATMCEGVITSLTKQEEIAKQKEQAKENEFYVFIIPARGESQFVLSSPGKLDAITDAAKAWAKMEDREFNNNMIVKLNMPKEEYEKNFLKNKGTYSYVDVIDRFLKENNEPSVKETARPSRP